MSCLSQKFSLELLAEDNQKNSAGTTPHESNDPVDYQREVKPLLAKHCYACHGPGKQESGLTLEIREKALAKLESGEHAIIPGKPETSELIARINTKDDSIQMPPEGARLKPKEIEILTRWIKEGAEWKQHWAFQPVKRPEVPTVKNPEKVSNPIDAFILKKLDKAGLKPVEQATHRELVRRVYFDITGMPPTFEEMEAVLNQPWPKAYENLVDKLLDSPKYGERWGRHWLDVVRYAESNSFERDNPKPHVWRYRDYVIKSLNEDKPYDRFIKEQLAGDELADANGDSLVATGFYRLGVWDDEPADPELAMYDGYDDIVTTVGQGFLGLTTNCARCHDHKIDPISQKDYYSMVSFFRAMKPMQTRGENIEEPFFESDQEKQNYEKKLENLRLQRDKVQQQITEIEETFQNALLNQLGKEVDRRDLANLKYKFYRDTWEKLPDFDNLKVETEADIPDQLIDIGLATREDDFGFVFQGELIVPKNGEYHFTLDSDDGSRLSLDGKELLLRDGIHGTGDPVTATITLKAGRIPLRVDYFQGHHGKGLFLSWSGPGFNTRMLTALPIEKKRNGKLPNINEMIMQAGQEILGRNTFEKYKALRRELFDLKEESIPAKKALCIKENAGNVPDTFVLKRGSPQAHGDKVEPAYLTILGGGKPAEILRGKFNDHMPTAGRRIKLAEWIASADNYLTTRVIMNRLWQHHFGRGIVRTPNNFGQLGEPPTHPELLDWLASELVTQGWSLKKMHKLILMSSTYRLSSKAEEKALARDPNNDLFWRFNMRRLEAEEIRDSVIFVSGNYNPEMYGESIYPNLSADVLATQSRPGQNWGKSSAEELGRRSIYIHVKRSLIVPILATFDFPDPDITCDARFTTTLPSQSLTMINSDFMNEQAKIFALNLLKKSQDTSVLIQSAYEQSYQRKPTSAELEYGQKVLSQYENEHHLSREQALTYYCLLLMNTNEFLYID